MLRMGGFISLDTCIFARKQGTIICYTSHTRYVIHSLPTTDRWVYAYYLVPTARSALILSGITHPRLELPSRAFCCMRLAHSGLQI